MDYRVYWNQGSGGSFFILEDSIGIVNQYSTTTTLADLDDGVEYRFKVVAMNAVDYGAVSSQVAIYAATIPNAPAAPTMVSQSDTAISIQWTENPLSDNGGSPVTDYRIYWDHGNADGVFVELVESTTPSLTYTLNTVDPGEIYSFKLTAINVVGESLKSTEVSIIASQEPGTPGTPVKVSADDSP
jgi:hypothetical protein